MTARDASERKKAAEAERRKRLSPRKAALQAHIDEIDQRISDWDDEVCIPGSGEPAGKRHAKRSGPPFADLRSFTADAGATRSLAGFAHG